MVSFRDSLYKSNVCSRSVTIFRILSKLAHTVDTIADLWVRKRWLLSLFLSNRTNLVISEKSLLHIIFEKNAGIQILFRKYVTSNFLSDMHRGHIAE